MPAAEEPPSLPFTASFPRRFHAALADARGAIAGIVASGDPANGGLVDARSLRTLHEIYRLRVELEIETAAVLWRTAEVVTAVSEALELLGRGVASSQTATVVRPARWERGGDEAARAQAA